ncbi:hypothetical protein WA538_005435, partial [Blastocystis sp. DL]
VFLGRKTFLDTYYDFGDKKLTLQNIWLRKRQNTWELKTGNNPKSDPNAVVGPVTTYYIEREGEEAISEALNAYDFFHGHTSFDSKLRLLQPLAIIETTRTSYRLNDHTKIDLDDARLIPTPDLSVSRVAHYALGEVEIMVNDQADLHSSHIDRVEQELKQVRELLGVSSSTKVISKIERYFLEFLPKFYEHYPYR